VGGLALRPTNQPSSHLSSPTSYSGDWEWLRLRLRSGQSGTNFDLEIRADIECRQSHTRDGDAVAVVTESFVRRTFLPITFFLLVPFLKNHPANHLQIMCDDSQRLTGDGEIHSTNLRSAFHGSRLCRHIKAAAEIEKSLSRRWPINN
jgi:hypothetical protein